MTNQITTLENVQTMSSKEIAELTGKRHDHVLRDIDNIVKSLSPELGLGFKSSTYKDSTGKSNRCYQMDKDSTLCLITGYDVNARMRIIKRWQELEAQAQKPKYNLAFIERAMINRASIEDGYFSVIDVVSDKIICGLEQMGAVFPDKFCPDISVGILWSKYLKKTGRSVEYIGVKKYKHRYPPPNQRVVDAYQYPNEMYAEFLEWLRSDWMSKHMYRYFSGKDKELMLLADKAIKTGWLPKPTFYLN